MHPEALTVLVLALAIDRFLGEPPDRLHPTVYLGYAISFLMRRLPRNLSGGVLLLFIPTVLSSVAAYALLAFLHGAGQVLAAGALLKLTVSWRGLREYVTRVKYALEGGDLLRARSLLRYVVSRDPSQLENAEVCSACVESAAENTTDAVASPLFYFTLFSLHSLELGVAAAAAYRAVNTLDAMVGYHKYGNFGAPSAKLDDLLNYPVARLVAPFLLLACHLTGADTQSAVSTLRKFAGMLQSPNAGIPMSIISGALRVRLIKPGHYEIGTFERLPEREDIEATLKIVDVALLLYVGVLMLVLLLA